MAHRIIFCSHGFEHVIEQCDVCGDDVATDAALRVLVTNSAVHAAMGNGLVLCRKCFAVNVATWATKLISWWLTSHPEPPSSE